MPSVWKKVFVNFQKCIFIIIAIQRELKELKIRSRMSPPPDIQVPFTRQNMF